MPRLMIMENSYDQIAEQWHSNDRGQAYLNRVLGYVDLVLAGLPPGARVLDLGCGTGQPIAKHIVKRGFRVVGVDQSAKMLEIARKGIPEGEFVQGDMIAVALEQGFAGAVAWDSIFHLQREHHSAIYCKLAKALAPGARILLSVGGSGAERITSEMFGQTFSYSGFEPETTRALLEAAGFAIERWEVDDPTSHGHLVVIARRGGFAAVQCGKAVPYR